MSDWQKIETAPKDGTEILGCWSKSKICSVVSCEGNDTWTSDTEYVSAPTHWMPLPKLPTE